MRSEQKNRTQNKGGNIVSNLGAVMSRGFLRAAKQVTANCEQFCSEPLLAEAIASDVLESLNYVAFAKLGEVQHGIEDAFRKFVKEFEETGKRNWKYHEEADKLVNQIDEAVKEELEKKKAELYALPDCSKYVWWDGDERDNESDKAVCAFVLDEVEWAIQEHFYTFVEFVIDRAFTEVGY